MKTPANPWRDVVALVVGAAALVAAALVLPSPARAEGEAVPPAQCAAIPTTL